jgi:signal transduction histidine kinase
MVQKVSSSSPVNFTVAIDDLDGLFSRQAEINVFRIVQEAINNIVKHSGATAAAISIKHDTAQVALVIRDDGKGFQVEDDKTNGTGRRRGLGLQGMVERVRILRGEWTIESSPGKGTRISIKLPHPRSPVAD